MKITAFIVSILLSTAALAENQVSQYDDVNMAKLDHAIADGKVTVVEGADEAVEWAYEKFDRGDITEEQKNGLIRSIYSIEAARATAEPISGLSALSQHTGEGECAQGGYNGHGRPFFNAGLGAGTIIGIAKAAKGGGPFGIIGWMIVGGIVGQGLQFLFGNNDTISDACTQVGAFSSGETKHNNSL